MNNLSGNFHIYIKESEKQDWSKITFP